MISRRTKVLRWGLFLIWIAVIFIMSQLPGEQSSAQSDLVLKLFSLVGIELNDYFGELATFIIRKCAHFSEYLILFILVYRVLVLYIEKGKAKIIAVIFVFGYALSDEFHQKFIEGRASSFRDVMIDTSGGILGCLITIIKDKIKANRKNNIS